MAEQNTAYLSNNGEYTTFSFGGRSLIFLTSKSLERCMSVNYLHFSVDLFLCLLRPKIFGVRK